MAKKLFVIYNDNGKKIQIEDASSVDDSLLSDYNKKFYRIFEESDGKMVEITNCVHGAHCGKEEAEKFQWSKETLAALNLAGQGDDQFEDLTDVEYDALCQCGFKSVLNNFKTRILL